MKLKIFNSPDDEKEKEVFLKLCKGSLSGTIYLCACDKNGKEFKSGHILLISENGIYIYDALDDKLGFQVDSRKRIKVFL